MGKEENGDDVTQSSRYCRCFVCDAFVFFVVSFSIRATVRVSVSY